MKKGRPFLPEEVIFAPTAQCNLHCAHCFVDRTRGTGTRRLSAENAIRFLENCAESGIERVGFSGGEPFLALSFLTPVISKTVELDLLFDRLMTNGVWWNTEEECRTALEAVYTAGFDGRIGLSIDAWHAQDPGKLAFFIRTAFSVFGHTDLFEISTVSDRQGNWPTEILHAAAHELGAKLILDGTIPTAIMTVSHSLKSSSGSNPLLSESDFTIPVTAIRFSAPPGDANAWNAGSWFTDDWCEGPGHVLYVHADESVAVCCGFANERPELIVGSISDPVETLVSTAQGNPHITACYVEGLSSVRKVLEKKGAIFPGKTDDICFFCDWLCNNGLSGNRTKPVR
ncbi:MAG: 4Fe-4S cluster-binding domain-containing protein [Treponema sp.]|nr:MAG: pyrroloquinoline quinone biosynthesis protein PqqE [Spirochaetes bacterium ADurb.Bin269]TAH54156.1 MAG: 4Fe-4S cluster-binding domain-containing protein [Treponema sp.]